MQNNLKKNMKAVNTDMKNTKNRYVKNLKTTHDSLSKNLSQQYEMYKTGINTEGSNAISSIQNMNKSVTDASEQAIGARDKAKEYADLSNKIYNDVFGALTTRVIQQDNVESQGKQGFDSMDGTGYIKPDPSNKNLFDLEKDLVLKINQFNNTYYNFVRCSSGGSVNCDTGNKKTEQNVKDDADAVMASATNLQNAYTNAKTNILTNDTTFKSNHQEIMDKSRSIDELRRNLDSKMDFIMKSRNPPNELTQQYDSTVYTGIMWSVLATSVLFYIFTEM
jgi:predicted  nucleic acid-binding Zn-ribbon protein